MLWLKRLFASKQRLVGTPNFDRAPWRTLNISGTLVRFKNPPQTSRVPNKFWPEQVELYNEDYEEWHNGRGLSKEVFKNFWSFSSHLLWGKYHEGGVDYYFNTTTAPS